MARLTNAWNEIFKQRGRAFTEPHEDMLRIVQLLKDRAASTVLDLGSGTGRHVVYLARSGFSVFGLDSSPEGISLTRQWLADQGLEAHLRLQGMTEKLSYEDAFFDAVVSVQVIHHADIATIKKTVEEVGRILKRGGFLFVTVPKLRNQGAAFEQIEPGTFIPLDGPERGLLHHYFTPEELREVFDGFEIADIHSDAVHHYCLSAYKRQAMAGQEEAGWIRHDGAPAGPLVQSAWTFQDDGGRDWRGFLLALEMVEASDRVFVYRRVDLAPQMPLGVHLIGGEVTLSLLSLDKGFLQARCRRFDSQPLLW